MAPSVMGKVVGQDKWETGKLGAFQDMSHGGLPAGGSWKNKWGGGEGLVMGRRVERTGRVGRRQGEPQAELGWTGVEGRRGLLRQVLSLLTSSWGN